jgi:hypothetical protein
MLDVDRLEVGFALQVPTGERMRLPKPHGHVPTAISLGQGLARACCVHARIPEGARHRDQSGRDGEKRGLLSA